MGLSCSCDYDWDGESPWYEPGGFRVPTAGAACCECHAHLPAGEPAQAIDRYDPYEPEGEPPPYPEDVLDDEPECAVLARHWGQMYDAMGQSREDWEEAHGWHSENECYVEESTEFRCDRCAGLATALDGSAKEGGLGYCMILPGELVDNHVEYVAEHGQHEIGWWPGRDGVWQPRRLSRLDFAKREARRRWRNAAYIMFQGGWKWKLRTAWYRTGGRIPGKVMPRLGYVYRYDYERKRHYWTRPEKRSAT